MEHITAYFCTSLRARVLNQTASSWPETCYTAGPHANLEPCAKIPTHSARPKPQTATYRIACHKRQHRHAFCTSLRAHALHRTASSWPEAGYTAGPHATREPCAKFPTHSARAKPQTASCGIACHRRHHSTPIAPVRKGTRAMQARK